MVTSTYLDHKNAVMMDFFEVLAGLHGFFGENPADDDSDSRMRIWKTWRLVTSMRTRRMKTSSIRPVQDLNLSSDFENMKIKLKTFGIRFNFDFGSNFKVIQKLKFKN